VIGTTVGGTPELVRDGETGRLVPPADAHALAAAIAELLATPARARELAGRGQAEVLAQHSMDVAMRRTVAVYEAARAAARGPRS
jgi:glycosyltransferase involved in cell wall biosynthesis